MVRFLGHPAPLTFLFCRLFNMNVERAAVEGGLEPNERTNERTKMWMRFLSGLRVLCCTCNWMEMEISYLEDGRSGRQPFFTLKTDKMECHTYRVSLDTIPSYSIRQCYRE